MIRRTVRWLDSRLRLASFLRRSLDHIFPDHWSFMLGEIALYCYLVLVITGIFLMMFFNASATTVSYQGPYAALKGVSMSAAYRSVLDLSFKVRLGLLIRQIHHWAALVFIAAILAHMFRIFFTAAYRRPRELNWVIGVTLLILAMANGFLGYSLPDDLLSGTGLRVAYSIVLSIPVIGPWLAFIIFGGRVPTDAMIPRLYGLHVFVIPAALTTLLAIHLAIIWRQMHTNYPGQGRSESTIVGSHFWPTYAAKATGLFFLVFGVLAALGGIFEINPVWIYGPYKPANVMPGAQPDWYLGWAEGALRLCPSFNLHIWRRLVPEVFFPGVLLPTVLFALLYACPFIDRWITGDYGQHHVLSLPYRQPVRAALGCAALAFMLVLFVAGSDDVIAVAVGGSVVAIRTALRVAVLTAPVFTLLIVWAVLKLVNARYPD
jgi:ubiquinol-cytochrome c reductase cytochrome b subunit